MNKSEINTMLNIIANICRHPIAPNYIQGIVQNDGFDRICKLLEDGQYSSLQDVTNDIIRMIDVNSASNPHLVTAGNEIKRIFNRQYELYFPAVRKWAIRVTKLRSKLSDLSATPPATIKELCQFPSIHSIRKPDFHLYTESELIKLTDSLNSIRDEEVLQDIKLVIEQNESKEIDFSKINVATLKPSTLQEIVKRIQQ